MLLWEPEDEVMQFFPPESEYVNAHAYTYGGQRIASCRGEIEK